jgi:hypothetical protein
VSEFLRDLRAAGRPATTQRSYALALLRWFRFTWAVDVLWNQATRTEARDFCRWIQLADKPGGQRMAVVVPVPGKRPASVKYAPSTAAHCETVCRGFYSYHLEAGTGPIVNPFPMATPGRANAHHNPMDPFPGQKAGLFRPRVPRRIPRQIPASIATTPASWSGLSPTPPTSKIAEFAAILAERWPDTGEALDDDSPWAAAPLIRAASGPIMHFGMSWSRGPDEAAPFAAAAAAQLGLVCFNPQAGRLWR